MIRKFSYFSMDTVMCSMMHWTQWQLRHDTSTKKDLEIYLEKCASLDRNTFFALTPMQDLTIKTRELSWKSPIETSFLENKHARALFFPASHRTKKTPTLIILHALMSASDRGYRSIAKQMNQRGWNVIFPHLPFHYSRTPRYHLNGALAISTNLIRNGETIRQAVQEIRQLMHWIKNQGSEKIGILATSYGGWIASLLLSLEPVDFALLLQPITHISYATFESPLARVMASLLKAQRVTPEHLEAHGHLTSPLLGKHQSNPKHITILGGTYDRIAPLEHLRKFAKEWDASFEEIEQGHFGYAVMQKALKKMDAFI